MINENTNWEILVGTVAVSFSEKLKELLNDGVIQEIVDRNNKETMPDVCHSHDFCDANMIMDEAVKAVVVDWEFMPVSQFQKLWNDAWGRAKQEELYTNKPDQS